MNDPDPETAPNQLWQLLRSALPRWASFSPQQALAFAESLPEPPEYVGLALGAWAAADPAAALDMALVKSEEFSSQERSSAQLLDDYLRKIVGTLAVDEASAQGAVDLAQSIESPDTRQLLYSTLIDKLGANHHEEMLALIDEFEPMQRVALAEDLMLRANAWHVDGKSAEWALAQDSSVRESLLAGSIKHWHRLNPQAAENWRKRAAASVGRNRSAGSRSPRSSQPPRTPSLQKPLDGFSSSKTKSSGRICSGGWTSAAEWHEFSLASDVEVPPLHSGSGGW
ncbi:MAG: hypothetical protein R3F19_20560 [Verrucomicrobiales bacterium]